MQRILEPTKRVKDFIHAHWDKKSPLLLGFSGGPDSKALLHCLLDAGVTPLHLAHVDHGWREESGEEALQLAREADALGLPFHSIRLSERVERNLEDHARKARFAFFRELFQQMPFQALLLAHHRDDVAETALKRLLEGAHLPQLSGLIPRASIDGLPIWRPLLTIRKEALLQELERRSTTFLTDRTNDDPKFLRTRLRQGILPALAATFGKEVSENLAQLSERALELREYLERRVEVCWEEGKEKGVFDTHLLAAERLEVRYLVQKAVSGMKMTLTRCVLESLVDTLLNKTPYRQFEVGGRTLVADRGFFRTN